MSLDPAQSERLSLLLKHADERLGQSVDALNQAQLDGAKERSQYFEKLAIGSGAVIAAVVSFIGTHQGKLHPVWVLRFSLISLVLAMIAALYRNLRYPNYVLAVHNRIWIEASRYQQQRKNDLFLAHRDVLSWESGDPIDIDKWSKSFGESDAGLALLVNERVQREKRLMREFKAAEYV